MPRELTSELRRAAETICRTRHVNVWRETSTLPNGGFAICPSCLSAILALVDGDSDLQPTIQPSQASEGRKMIDRELTAADIPPNVAQMVRDYCRNAVTAGQTAANVANAIFALVDGSNSHPTPTSSQVRSSAPQEDTGAAELLDFFEAHKTKMGPAIRAACLDEFAPTIRATIAHCMAELEDADIDEFTGDDICEDDLRADAALPSNPSGEETQ